MVRGLNASPLKVAPCEAWYQTELWQSYHAILELLESGRCEEASASTREVFSDSDSPVHTALRRLISMRISMKSMAGTDGVIEVQKWNDVPWIEAESHFVLGLSKFHLGLFTEGCENFQASEKIFAALGFNARAYLSAYNRLIGQSYAKQFASIQDELRQLRELEKNIREKISETPHDLSRCKRVLALILRQKAVVFEKDQRHHAAMGELSQAIEIFEFEGPQSDYHLALLQIADLSLDAGDARAAKRFFETVIAPVDSRVEFALAYLKWRIFETPFQPSAFEVQPPFWKERYESRCRSQISKENDTILIWNLSQNELSSPETGQIWKVKPSSLEGKLIRILSKSRTSKHLIAETLWPEQAKVSHLDHRLHQLISRVNQKYSNLVLFDGTAYKLSCSVELR
jgi:tetratricopeptide (TPR) repeat protein